jgi:y4mF family transcriptional regulator
MAARSGVTSSAKLAKQAGGKRPKPIVRYPTASNALRVFLADGLREPPASNAPVGKLAGRLLGPAGRPAPLSGEPRRVVLKAETAAYVLGAPAISSSTAYAPSNTPILDTRALGRVVRLRRQSLDLTQQQLAERAGVGRRFVNELEGGKPTLELGKALTVCRSIGVVLTAGVANG